MQDFKEFLNWQNPEKPWSANKKQIINHWRSIEPNQPIAPMPVPKEKEGSTYGFDGIRITGSFEFVNSVMSRFKDFLYKETPHTKLNLVLRQIQGKKDHEHISNKYVFYVNVGERGRGRKIRRGGL